MGGSSNIRARKPHPLERIPMGTLDMRVLLLSGVAMWLGAAADGPSALRGGVTQDPVAQTEGATLEDAAIAPADTFADETTGFDALGPFLEEPSAEQDANPQPARQGWENVSLQAALFNTWGRSFCEKYTQVRCCRSSWGFEKCGTTVHSYRCGW